MRRTLLAVGFAVLLSMLLAPHGNREMEWKAGVCFFLTMDSICRHNGETLELRGVAMATLAGL
jgi:hypothetical protein